jgi:Zn-dependent peptidase ImmA (M78 family)
LYEPPLSIIVLNSQDSPNARRFTLAHELAHIMMRESGICDPLDDDNDVEQRCNSIAGESMLPRDLLAQRLERPGSAEDKIEALAREFRMSHSAVAVRLSQTGVLTRRRLFELLDVYRQQYVTQREVQAEGDGGPSYYVMQSHRLGGKFTAAVLEGYADGGLSTSQTADLLGVTPSHASIAAIQARASATYDR